MPDKPDRGGHSICMTLSDQLDAARRELALRRKAYPGWVRSGKMRPEKADHEIAAMAAICTTLHTCLLLQEEGLAMVLVPDPAVPTS